MTRRLKRPPFGSWLMAAGEVLEPKAKTWQPANLRKAGIETTDRSWPLSDKARMMMQAQEAAAAQAAARAPIYHANPVMASPTAASPVEADPPILIYDRPETGEQALAALCPTSLHPLPVGPWTFPTVTHLYECARFDPALDEEVFRYVLAMPTAADARNAAFEYRARQRPEWTEPKAVAIMRGATAMKMALYPPLANLLLATGTRQIWMASEAHDTFWQIGSTAKVGRNEYGKVLQDLRSRLRLERESGYSDVLQAILAIIPPVQEEEIAPASPQDAPAFAADAEASREPSPVQRQPSPPGSPAASKEVRFSDAPKEEHATV